MEICPKCGRRTLCYDPRVEGARCLNMDCDYSQPIEASEYTRLFEHGKNVAHKLTSRR